MATPRWPRGLMPTIDPRSWKPNQQALDKALGRARSEKPEDKK